LTKEIEQWNEAFKSDVIRFCQENNFHSGFFDGTENNMVGDAYELKVGDNLCNFIHAFNFFRATSLMINNLQVRLEHIIERIALVSDAANTERPSLVINNVFIGGALAARSKYTLQHLGITHVLCLCSNEIGQSDTQFPDLFQYKNFSVRAATSGLVFCYIYWLFFLVDGKPCYHLCRLVMMMMQTSVIFLKKHQILSIRSMLLGVRFSFIALKGKVGVPQLSLPT
jgi:hypothetical protein